MMKVKHSRADDYRKMGVSFLFSGATFRPLIGVSDSFYGYTCFHPQQHITPGNYSIPVGPHMSFGVCVNGERGHHNMPPLIDTIDAYVQQQAPSIEHGIGDKKTQGKVNGAGSTDGDLTARLAQIEREREDLKSTEFGPGWLLNQLFSGSGKDDDDRRRELANEERNIRHQQLERAKKQRMPPTQPPPTATANVAASSSREDRYARIDTLSALFETSGRHHGNCDGKCCQPGACCISSGYLDRGKTKKDPGGKSYGRHQFASAPEVGTLQGFLHNNPVIERDFAGLAIGSDTFDQKWIEMSHQKSFVEAQDKFIIKTNFTPVRKTANEVHLLNTEIIDQILYSCGVQHGPGGANQIVRNAARELESIGKLNDEQMTILCLYKHRAGYIDGIPDSKISPENKAVLKQNRCVEEREEALKTFAEKQSPALERPPAVVAQGLFRSQQDGEEAKKEVVPASSSAPAVDATPARR